MSTSELLCKSLTAQFHPCLLRSMTIVSNQVYSEVNENSTIFVGETLLSPLMRLWFYACEEHIIFNEVMLYWADVTPLLWTVYLSLAASKYKPTWKSDP